LLVTTSFGADLRRERERRQISLAAIAATTKINVALFEALERDDASKWPSGIFRRSFIRAYAQGIGLDPDAVARDFAERFPDPTEPERVRAPRDRPAVSAAPPLRLQLAPDAQPRPRREIFDEAGRRCAAVLCDAGIPAAIGAAAFAAFGTFWMPVAAAMGAYFGVGVIVLGSTPGLRLIERARRADASAHVSHVVAPPAPKRAPPLESPALIGHDAPGKPWVAQRSPVSG
jgi:transcriptional regulator with XRE-family HTH domain